MKSLQIWNTDTQSALAHILSNRKHDCCDREIFCPVTTNVAHPSVIGWIRTIETKCSEVAKMECALRLGFILKSPEWESY